MATASTAAVDRLGSGLADAAMAAAAVHMGRAGLTREQSLEVLERFGLVEDLRRECRQALDGALRDAREAVEAGMSDIATAGIVLDFQAAGRRAADSAMARFRARVMA